MPTPEQFWNNTGESDRVKWLLLNRFHPEWCNSRYSGLPIQIQDQIKRDRAAQIRANWNSLGVS